MIEERSYVDEIAAKLRHTLGDDARLGVVTSEGHIVEWLVWVGAPEARRCAVRAFTLHDLARKLEK